MNIALWVVQVLLALVFGLSGGLKTFVPIETIAQSLPWVLEYPAALIRFIGIAELAGAIGLVVPAASRIRPALTPMAAVGLAIVMVLAMGFHAMRGEYLALPTNLVLLGMAVFVVWGRTKRVPIPPRSLV